MATAISNDDENFFQAPQSAIGEKAIGPADAEIEAIRRQYIGHEVSYKSIGTLNYLSVFFGLLIMINGILATANVIDMRNPNNPSIPVGLIVMMIGLIMMMISGALGYGMRALQPWARWLTIIGTALGLLYFIAVMIYVVASGTNRSGVNFAVGIITIFILVDIYILYLVCSSKATTICSREYKEIIRLTPYVKYKTSLAVKIILGLFVFMIVMGIVAGFVSSSRG